MWCASQTYVAYKFRGDVCQIPALTYSELTWANECPENAIGLLEMDNRPSLAFYHHNTEKFGAKRNRIVVNYFMGHSVEQLAVIQYPHVLSEVRISGPVSRVSW
jgi:hypothetical protein